MHNRSWFERLRLTVDARAAVTLKTDNDLGARSLVMLADGALRCELACKYGSEGRGVTLSQQVPHAHFAPSAKRCFSHVMGAETVKEGGHKTD